MDEKNTPCVEWCPTSFQYLKGKKLRLRLLPEGEEAKCELCGRPLASCGCRPRSGLYEPESESGICESCFGVFKEIYLWQDPDKG